PNGGRLKITDGDVVRASADGRVYTIMRPESSPQGIKVLVLNGTQVKQFYSHHSAGHLVPGPEGKFIYTGRGVYNQEAKLLPEIGGSNGAFYTLPAVQGNFYIALEPVASNMAGIGKGGPGTIGIYMAGDSHLLARLTDIE